MSRKLVEVGSEDVCVLEEDTGDRREEGTRRDTGRRGDYSKAEERGRESTSRPSLLPSSSSSDAGFGLPPHLYPSNEGYSTPPLFEEADQDFGCQNFGNNGDMRYGRPKEELQQRQRNRSKVKKQFGDVGEAISENWKKMEDFMKSAADNILSPPREKRMDNVVPSLERTEGVHGEERRRDPSASCPAYSSSSPSPDSHAPQVKCPRLSRGGRGEEEKKCSPLNFFEKLLPSPSQKKPFEFAEIGEWISETFSKPKESPEKRECLDLEGDRGKEGNSPLLRKLPEFEVEGGERKPPPSPHLVKLPSGEEALIPADDPLSSSPWAQELLLHTNRVERRLMEALEDLAEKTAENEQLKEEMSRLNQESSKKAVDLLESEGQVEALTELKRQLHLRLVRAQAEAAYARGKGGAEGAPALCVACLEAPSVMVSLPCRHLVLCEDCAPRLSTCPMCRVDISSNLRVFGS